MWTVRLIRSQQGATLYTIQLGLNLVWMPLFFGLKRPIEATVDIVALTGITSYLAYIWSHVDTTAAWSLAPYLGWLGFATYLSVRLMTQMHYYCLELTEDVVWHGILEQLGSGW